MNRHQGLAAGILFILVYALFMPLLARQAQSVAPLQLGDALPDVIGQNLSGNPAHLSTEVAHKVAVVVFSFSRSGGKDMQLWNTNLLRDFGSEPSVSLSTVIMLESAPRLLRSLIVSRLRKDMPPALQRSTIVSYENEMSWKQRLRVADDSHAYVLLLGQNGSMRWMNSGALSDTRYNELKTKIRGQFESEKSETK